MPLSSAIGLFDPGHDLQGFFAVGRFLLLLTHEFLLRVRIVNISRDVFPGIKVCSLCVGF